MENRWKGLPLLCSQGFILAIGARARLCARLHLRWASWTSAVSAVPSAAPSNAGEAHVDAGKGGAGSARGYERRSAAIQGAYEGRDEG